MKKLTISLLGFALLSIATAAVADGPAAEDTAEETDRAEYEIMLEEAENARIEAEAARLEAAKVSEKARELAHRHQRAAREAAEGSREEQERARQARELEREEMARAREELSRAHRELREASREVARAHRELSRNSHEIKIMTEVNLGDRAVIGVVLGQQRDGGVEIIGVSPDGPAERAGLLPGDLLISIQGQDLAGDEKARETIFHTVRHAEDGEALLVVVRRDGQPLEYTVTAERREPGGWQSVVRIPDNPVIAAGPDDYHMIVERIEIPEIDEEALAAEMAQLAERLEHQYQFTFPDGLDFDEYDFDVEHFSELGSQMMSEANIWFGLPVTRGLELASMNEGLGRYFETDRGVLVIQARDDNAYELRSGDVILAIGSFEVDSPADMIRALRDIDPGSEIAIEIKRERRKVTLSVVVPENRLGYRHGIEPHIAR